MLTWLLRGIQRGVVTTRYPKAPAELPAGFRGRLTVAPERCQPHCQQCVEACPVEALQLTVERGRASLAIHHGRCIQCGLCVEACPTQALFFEPVAEVASYSREALVETFRLPWKEAREA